MKKVFIFALTLCLQFAATMPVKADEGMWTLFNLPKQVYAIMQAEGCNIPYENLYQSDNAVMRSVVNFSGFCSGVVVSPQGLVFTNHHCGYEAIRSHSTVDNDIMINGFCAKTTADELPNKEMFVAFMVDQSDITDKLIDRGIRKMTSQQADSLIEAVRTELEQATKQKDSTLYVEIDPFYEGNAYYATTYRAYPDVRLVFAPTQSIGKFGGETDNWMWPRQTCDFSVFRVYCDPKTGMPAPYSKDNVPLKTTHYTQVSTEGYQPGSFAMTMGYPGSTSRYLSSYGIQERRNAMNLPIIDARTVKQEVMKRHMLQSEAVRIKYDSHYAESANYWKNSIGMNKCIDSIGLIRQKQAYEQRIKAYVDSTGYLKGQLDFSLLDSLYRTRQNMIRTLVYFRECFSRGSEFARRAIKLAHMEVKGNEKDVTKQYLSFENEPDDWDEATDKDLLVTTLNLYRTKAPSQYLPTIYNVIDSKYQGDTRKYVDRLYSKSFIMKKGARYPAKKDITADMGGELSVALQEVISDLQAETEKLNEQIDEQERLLCQAKLVMEQNLPHYSDANFTMRLSYGQVKEYRIGGQPSGYYTTAESLINKMNLGNNGVADYKVQPEIQSLMAQKQFGQYQDKTTGKMQLCFLTTNDITGGNSGSPIFNGEGKLIGLAFDGNWDSLASDIHYDAELARCIGVDIRYVLFMMDKWGNADRLIREMGIRK